MLKELKNIIRLVLPALLLSFVSGAAEWSVVSAQVQVEQRIDSIEMLIGEQTLLHLQVTMKNGQRATLPHFKPGSGGAWATRPRHLESWQWDGADRP